MINKMIEKYVEEIEKERPKNYRVARNYNIGINDSEDIFQDVLLELVGGGIETFRGESRFSTWFHRCFVNRCISHLKEKKRRRFVENTIEIDEKRFLNEDSDNKIYEENSRNELFNRVSKLKPIYKEVIIMRYWDNLKYGQISERLGVPIGTVRSRLNKAKRNLKMLLVCSDFKYYNEDK